MFFWQNKLTRRALRLFDLLLVALSCLLAFWLKASYLGPFSGLSSEPNYLLVLLLYLLFCNFTFNFFDFYSSCIKKCHGRRVLKTSVALIISTSILVFCMYILHLQDVSRGLLVLANGIAFVALLGRQYLTEYWLSTSRLDGHNSINILIVGSKERARETINSILEQENSHYNVIGCLEIEKQYIDKQVVEDIRVIGTMADLRDILTHSVVDELIFALPLKKVENVQEYISFAEELGVQVRIMPDWQIQKIMYRPETASISFETFAQLPTLSLSSTPKKDLDLLMKGLIDYVGALVGLAVLSPVLLLISVAIKLTSRGPVFFVQERCGLNGRRFSLYKFRTMVENAEELRDDLLSDNEMDGPVFKLKDDPRITFVGRFLRKTSLDELPQLFNVVRGHMSLVGPRPPLPEEVEKYTPAQRRRLSMKPGLTCIWQVSGRNNINFEDWMKLDLKYIDNWSLKLDLKLLARTLVVVFAGTGR